MAGAPPTVARILQLQRMIGNAAVARLVRASRLHVARSPSPTVTATFPSPGVVKTRYSAALRSAPVKDPDNPYSNILADLPRGTLVEVLGKTHGWLNVQVELGGKTLVGHVSHELVNLAVGPTFLDSLVRDAWYRIKDAGDAVVTRALVSLEGSEPGTVTVGTGRLKRGLLADTSVVQSPEGIVTGVTIVLDPEALELAKARAHSAAGKAVPLPYLAAVALAHEVGHAIARLGQDRYGGYLLSEDFQARIMTRLGVPGGDSHDLASDTSDD